MPQVGLLGTRDELQQRVHQWIMAHEGYWSHADMGLRLSEETGEVNRELLKLHGAKVRSADPSAAVRGRLALELADVIFTACCLANANGIDLGVAVNLKFNELDRRFAQKG